MFEPYTYLLLFAQGSRHRLQQGDEVRAFVGAYAVEHSDRHRPYGGTGLREHPFPTGPELGREDAARSGRGRVLDAALSTFHLGLVGR